VARGWTIRNGRTKLDPAEQRGRRTLSIDNQPSLVIVEGLEELVELEEVHVYNCPKIDFADLCRRLAPLPQLCRLELRPEVKIPIPSELGELHQVLSLQLAAYYVDTEAAMDVVARMRGLRALEILGTLPCAVGKLQQVRELRAFMPPPIPDEIGELALLEKLTIEGKKLKLPAAIAGMRALRELRAERCQLRSLPDELGELAELRVLDLTGNRALKKLPASISELRGLEELHVAGTGIERLPDGPWPKLRVLLAPYDIKQVPEEILARTYDQCSLPAELLARVKFAPPPTVGDELLIKRATTTLDEDLGDPIKLELDMRDLAEPPAGLGELRRLETLILDTPRLDAARVLEALEQATALRSIAIRPYTPLGRMPASIARFRELRGLFLGAGLVALPPEIAALANLESLGLGSNRLFELPDELGELAALTALDIGDNPVLVRLPAAHGRLTNLRELSVKAPLVALPDALAAAPLEEVRLIDTRFATPPELIGRLSRLRRLVLWQHEPIDAGALLVVLARAPIEHLTLHLPMDALPREIGMLRELRTLSCWGSLRRLPVELRDLPHLRELRVRTSDVDDSWQQLAMPGRWKRWADQYRRVS
jgi:Leucine-rich repeat (LRR) protein